MFNYKKLILKSILAGILISIGCWAFLSVENKIIGAFIFSFALFSIITLKLPLFTGRVGEVVLKEIPGIILILIGNTLGTACMGFLYSTIRNIDSVFLIATSKQSDAWYTILIEAVLCGILMQIAVSNAKNSENQVFGISLPVVVFLLIGAEHIIANLFYFFASGVFPVIFILLNILGNAIGGILTYRVFLCSMKYPIKN